MELTAVMELMVNKEFRDPQVKSKFEKSIIWAHYCIILGAHGYRGQSGESGPQGPRGDPGEGGINSKGTKGDRGFDGKDGEQGPAGFDGLPGDDGKFKVFARPLIKAHRIISYLFI